MLDPGGRSLREIARQRATDQSGSHSRRAAVQSAAFADFRFALFFSSDYVGIRFEDIGSLMDRADGNASSVLPCGVLTVKDSHGWRSIEFSQGADDLLTPRVPDMKLKDVTSEPFESGLKRVFSSCTFDPPLTDQSAAPWVSECVIEQQGQNGHSIRKEYRVTVATYSTDESVIDAAIETILGRIPEGAKVSTNEPIDYVWSGQQVVRRIDTAALAQAEKLRFVQGGSENARWRVIVVLNALGLSLVVIYLLFFRRRGRNR